MIEKVRYKNIPILSVYLIYILVRDINDIILNRGRIHMFNIDGKKPDNREK